MAGAPPPSPPRQRSRLAGWLGSLGTIGLLILTLGGKLKFLLPLLKFAGPFLKTGGTMLLSIWVYAWAFGWVYGVGFVLLLFVHEMGHVLAARNCGIKVTAPTFIPFIGAHILLQERLPGVWVEAKIGIAGPVAGAFAAAVCHLLWLTTGHNLWAALAYVGYFLNLFNLMPVSPLDGGRITGAISPWLWVLGYGALGSWLAWDIAQAIRGESPLGTGVFIMALILFTGLPRFFSLFRRQSEAERRYFVVTPAQRWTMALGYFGLIGSLSLGMMMTHLDPRALRDAERATRPAGVEAFAQAAPGPR